MPGVDYLLSLQFQKLDKIYDQHMIRRESLLCAAQGAWLGGGSLAEMRLSIGFGHCTKPESISEHRGRKQGHWRGGVLFILQAR